jgi:uncharacterized protein (DUF2126 family)
VDEARNDALYELEIAFNQIPEKGPVPPWLVDRIFRDVLVDVTGNAHRAEFCIDKLYSPGGGSGRQGLLELRAFEMPPHERMSLVQQLLVRALIAEFWDRPYRQPLVPWGTELHDRFLLPHFVWQDFCDVVADLTEEMPFRNGLFSSEFHSDDRRNELSRIVLSSAERSSHGMFSEEDRLRTVSMDSSPNVFRSGSQGWSAALPGPAGIRAHAFNGTVGDYVAGVRYRAWQPSTCLHPQYASNALVFDLYDNWNENRAGCPYHVQSRRAKLHFPVNAYEAESRRLSASFRQVHSGM